MIELLKSTSLTQIIITIFLALVAVKEVMTLVDYFHKKFKGAFDDENLMQIIHDKVVALEAELKIQQNLNEKLDARLEFLEEDARQRKILDEERHNYHVAFQQECAERLDKQQEVLTLLTNSDRDDIKSWIVQQYHYFYETKKWIDDFSMDSLEKRYACYQKEGGNSYITDLVEQIRTLPKRPPQ
jgi:hypothetical protein